MAAVVWRIGLTGGIGSGKSTVAHTLQACGAAVIDADAISRQLTAPGGHAIQAIAAQFGADAIGPDGAMDRGQVRALIFTDASARKKLEAIIHPLVSRESLKQAEQAIELGKTCLVFDIPLLVESGRWRQHLDRVVVVDCNHATQIERVLARESSRPDITHDAIDKIIAGQATRKQRLAAADICICNQGLSLPQLDALVRQTAHIFGL